MLVPAWGIGLAGMSYIGYVGMDLFMTFSITLCVLFFELLALLRHIRVWRFKEMYFKIYQGLSVLIVDSDLRLDPEKLNSMFTDIEQAALEAICTDPTMHLMAGTLSRVSGLEIPKNVEPHKLDAQIRGIRNARQNEIHDNNQRRWWM